jgi:ketosteroid isomerase-like protein
MSMNRTHPPRGPAAVLEAVALALNTHDVEVLVDCFDENYVNETPVHPNRGFRGREQVRRNWTRIFAAVPDLHVRIVGMAVEGDTAWSEWEHSGTRLDGSPHLLRGVVIFTVARSVVSHARFYLEPVEHSSGGIDAAIANTIGRGASQAAKEAS